MEVKVKNKKELLIAFKNHLVQNTDSLIFLGTTKYFLEKPNINTLKTFQQLIKKINGIHQKYFTET